jgi:hypothetical protein
MSKYTVNANSNRTFSGSKAAIMRVWKTWARLGFAPQAYEITDGERGIVTRRIAWHPNPAPGGQTGQEAKMHYETLTAAIEDAMTDYLENGTFSPHNPAICRDSRGYYYGSSLHGDEVIADLAGGFGSWEPTSVAEIGECASGMAAELE